VKSGRGFPLVPLTGTLCPDDPLSRRLTTIVALDVAGYSARTEADEARTMAEVAALCRHQ
jgi:class 3 adenylate cyclase